ncbi:MAG: amidohydrolase family protein [Chitinophagaceae bacterium]|nr:amidohydrolase family protein [Chitinophagaceae bacterium]
MDLLLHNANICSFHEGYSAGKTDALAVRGDRIFMLGRSSELLPLAHPGTKIVDLGGKTVLPGFHDTHIHIWKVGNLKTYMLDVRATTSLDEMLSLIAAYHRAYPEAAWITARGFNEAAWKEGRMPTRHDLDKVVKDKPVYVIRTCAHIAVANTAALEAAGITARTSAPEGGIIYKDDNGRPNGLFSETALGLITAHIPPYNKAELKTMVRAARAELYRYGITAATDPAVDPVLLEAYREMEADGELGFRLQAIPILLPDGGSRPFPLPEQFRSDLLTVDTVKFFSDGGLSGRTAALKGTYKNSTEKGVLRLQKDSWLTLCRAAHEKGWGIATHAIGDAAIEFVIQVYRSLSASFPSMRRRIEHLGLPEEQHLRDMAGLQIGTSMQTIFLHELGRNFINYLGEDYLRRCYPVRSVLQQGILTALSSDAPVVSDLNPLQGVQTAITRHTREGLSIAPEEAIGVHQALKAYTISAAGLSGLDRVGTLQPGHLADVIVLDQDPCTTSTDKLTDIRVEQTYIGGRCVFHR